MKKLLSLALIFCLLAGCNTPVEPPALEPEAAPEAASQMEESPAPQHGQPAPAQPAPGEIEVSFAYVKRSGPGSNQFAVWIEDEAGSHIKTLYSTRFTADGGWKIREMSLPLWVERFAIASRTQEDIDMVSSATPGPGTLSYRWDLTDEYGAAVPGGQYRVMVEGSTLMENRVLYSCDITLGETVAIASPQPQPEYFGEDTAPREMLSDVSILWIPVL